MTKPSKNMFVGDLGLVDVRKRCCQAEQIFREVTFADVGVDAFIEVVLEGAASGVLIGVQVKAGPSFVDDGRFRFPADREHVAYWNRCAFPMIGVVHDARTDRSVWLDLKALCTDQRVLDGPYVFSVPFDAETDFTSDALIRTVIPRVVGVIGGLTMEGLRNRIKTQSAAQLSQLPEQQEASESKEEAWLALVTILLSPTVTDEVRLDAAYRLSWYMPAVSGNQQRQVVESVSGLSEFQLLALLRAAGLAWSKEREDVAEHVLDLLRYDLSIPSRVEQLLLQKMLPRRFNVFAVQVIESLQNAERSDLWAFVNREFRG